MLDGYVAERDDDDDDDDIKIQRQMGEVIWSWRLELTIYLTKYTFSTVSFFFFLMSNPERE